MRKYVISISTSYISRMIGMVSTIMLTRLLPVEIFGFLSLLQSTAQSAGSMFRVGINYSYTVLIPRVKNLEAKKSLTSTYLLLSLALSIPWGLAISISTFRSIQGSGVLGELNSYMLFVLILLLVLLECWSELCWSILFPIQQYMEFVLYKDPLTAIAKLVFPLICYSVYSVHGLLAGLIIVSVSSIIGNLFVAGRRLIDIGRCSYLYVRFYFVKILFSYGIVGYIYPFLANILMLPLMLKIAGGGGLVDIGSIRLGSWGAQLVTSLGAGVAPILLVKNSESKNVRSNNLSIINICGSLYILGFAGCVVSINLLNYWLFDGKYSSYVGLQILTIAGAVLQSLVQLLFQRRLSPSQQIKGNTFLCLSMISCYVLILILPGINLAYKYAIIPLASNLIFVIFILSVQDLALILDVNSRMKLSLVSICATLAIGSFIPDTVLGKIFTVILSLMSALPYLPFKSRS